jgi:hypothetical protein
MTMIIVFKLKIFNYYFVFLDCVNYKIKLKQSNFERYAKNILGFEHFSSQIRDIKKIASSVHQRPEAINTEAITPEAINPRLT